ncbi:MAG TPA: cytochrome c3 family protein [Steroidobacteraceae bacterium]|nr:cytochrome c3 family protein [Steroidobacteraceae bacterium]
MFRGIIRSIARLLALTALLSVANTQVEAIQRTGFDHLTTGFELRDAHRDMACEYCHVNGVFKGTPRTCEGCHTIGGRISATPKPPRHIASVGNCALCHAGYNFAPVFRMDHTGAKGSCVSCHNGLTATGKDVKHIPSDNNCTACHTTVAFMPARMEHADLLQKEQCIGCHNGVRASAKTLHHVPTMASCNDCHTTLSWSPARFNHSGLLTNCQSCHNGITATGKVSNHVATPLECSECHRYPSWSSLKVVRPPASERLAKEPPAGATTPIAKPPAPGQRKASDGAFH